MINAPSYYCTEVIIMFRDTGLTDWRGKAQGRNINSKALLLPTRVKHISLYFMLGSWSYPQILEKAGNACQKKML
jgi:hypothetical protein